MASPSRVYVRLKRESQAIYAEAAGAANLRGASAMTLVLETFAARLAKDRDFLLTMTRMKRAFCDEDPE